MNEKKNNADPGGRAV